MIRNSLYNLTGGVVRLTVSLVSVPILLQVLGPARFGIYSIANAVISFLSLAEWSVCLTTTILLSGENSKNLISSCFYSSAILGIIISSAIYTTALFISSIFPSISREEADQLSTLLKIGCFTLFFRVVMQFFIGVEQSNNKYSLHNIITSIYNIVFGAGSVLISLYSQSLTLIFIYQLAITIISLAVHLRFNVKFNLITDLKQLLFWSTKNLKVVFLHSSRIWPSAFGSALFTQGDKLILGNLLGPSLTGVYSALASLVTQINSLSALPIQPLITHIKERRPKTDYGQILTAISLNTSIATSIGLILICFQPEIANLILGKWSNNYDLKIMMLTMIGIYVVYSYNAVGYYILFATNREALNTVVSISASLTSLFLIYILTINFGINGSIVGNIGYWVSLIFLYEGYKEIGFKWMSAVKIYILSLLALLLSFLTAFFEILEIRIVIFLACGSLILIANSFMIKRIYNLTKLSDGLR